MRIDFVGRRWFIHGIRREEVRAVVEYPIVVSRVEQRIPGTDPFIFVGRYDENEPPIEVGAEPVTDRHWPVFHAAMLRVAKALGLDKTYPDVVRDIANQRVQVEET